MKTMMNTPGFTAEATLYRGKGFYQAGLSAGVYGGNVQPAVFRRPGLYCLKFQEECSGDPSDPEACVWHTSVGRVNPVTGVCE